MSHCYNSIQKNPGALAADALTTRPTKQSNYGGSAERHNKQAAQGGKERETQESAGADNRTGRLVCCATLLNKASRHKNCFLPKVLIWPPRGTSDFLSVSPQIQL